MALQLTYPADYSIGREGDHGKSGGPFNVLSLVNPTTDWYFGRAVVEAASAEEFAVPSSLADRFIGVPLRTHSRTVDLLPISGDLGIPATEPANIVTQGRLIVIPETDVALGDPVYYRVTGAGADPQAIGRFRTDADGDPAEWTLVPAVTDSAQHNVQISVPRYGITRTAQFTSGVGTTAALIVDGLVADLSVINGPTGDPLITLANDTNTLVVASLEDGLEVQVVAFGAGVWTSALLTTPPTAEAVRIPSGVRWASTGAAGSPVYLDLNLPTV